MIYIKHVACLITFDEPQKESIAAKAQRQESHRVWTKSLQTSRAMFVLEERMEFVRSTMAAHIPDSE